MSDREPVLRPTAADLVTESVAELPTEPVEADSVRPIAARANDATGLRA